MFQVYNDQTADGIWQSLVSAFRHKDDTDIVMSRLGPMHEMLHVGLSISNPRQRWVVSRSPGINPAFSLAEIIWIINGRHDSSFLNYFNRVLPRYAGCGLTYHGAYGYRLRRHFDVDQLERTYQVLRHQPDSRQAVLQIWDSRVDLPDPEGNPSSPDIPCNVVAFLKVRNGALEWTQIIRSNDLFRGLAYNIVQFTALQEIMAGWLGVGLGGYSQFSDSLHLYFNDCGNVCSAPAIEPATNTDSLALPKDESELVFKDLARRAEEIASSNTSTKMVEGLFLQAGLPEAYQNMLSILCAEGARRRQDVRVAEDLISQCTNPAYRQLWDHWIARFARREMVAV